MKKVGIRYEDKYVMERRVPLVPAHIKKLIAEEGLVFSVETSAKRVYSDEEYEAVGASITDDLADCPVIFGVKEIPIDRLEADKTYIFFSHVIKGQPHNMPMLKRLMELNCTPHSRQKDELWRSDDDSVTSNPHSQGSEGSRA